MPVVWAKGVVVNEKSDMDAPLRAPEKLALAQQAFRQFHARCFWFMREDAQVTVEDLPYVCQRLRADGGREGFFLAAKICQ
jgi:hypothetical protein